MPCLRNLRIWGQRMNATLKRLALAVTGSVVGTLLTLLVVALWGWLTEGGFVRGLGGASQAQLQVAIRTLSFPTALPESF